MAEHHCEKEGFLGQVKEFMDEMKGFRTTLCMCGLSILLSVGSAIWWGSNLSATVTKNTCQVWTELTPTAKRNEMNIEKILSRLDTIKFIYAQGEKGETGKQGETGKDYDSKN